MKYEYGVEYPTNGKKPDLPDDVTVEVKIMSSNTFGYRSEVGELVWCRTNAFRIVDERYKPNEPEETSISTIGGQGGCGISSSNSDNSWHERGELPPVGAECEYSIAELPRKTCTFVGINSRGSIVIEDCHGQYKSYHTHQIKLHPIKSERERLIDVISSAGNLSDGMLADAILAAGFRAPE